MDKWIIVSLLVMSVSCMKASSVNKNQFATVSEVVCSKSSIILFGRSIRLKETYASGKDQPTQELEKEAMVLGKVPIIEEGVDELMVKYLKDYSDLTPEERLDKGKVTSLALKMSEKLMESDFFKNCTNHVSSVFEKCATKFDVDTKEFDYCKEKNGDWSNFVQKESPFYDHLNKRYKPVFERALAEKVKRDNEKRRPSSVE